MHQNEQPSFAAPGNRMPALRSYGFSISAYIVKKGINLRPFWTVLQPGTIQRSSWYRKEGSMPDNLHRRSSSIEAVMLSFLDTFERQ